MGRALVCTVSTLAFGALTAVTACSTFSADAAGTATDAGADAVGPPSDSAAGRDVATTCVCDDGVSTLDSCNLR